MSSNFPNRLPIAASIWVFLSGSFACALTPEQALLERTIVAPSPPTSDLDQIYATAIRRALVSNDLVTRPMVVALPRVVVARDPSSIGPASLPGGMGVAFLLLLPAEIREIANWHGDFFYLRLELKAIKDGRALVWVEAINSGGPGCMDIPDGFVAEIRRTSGTWKYARSGAQALLKEYGLADPRVMFEKHWE